MYECLMHVVQFIIKVPLSLFSFSHAKIRVYIVSIRECLVHIIIVTLYLSLSLSLSMCICIYIYMYMYEFIYTYGGLFFLGGCETRLLRSAVSYRFHTLVSYPGSIPRFHSPVAYLSFYALVSYPGFIPCF